MAEIPQSQDPNANALTTGANNSMAQIPQNMQSEAESNFASNTGWNYNWKSDKNNYNVSNSGEISVGMDDPRFNPNVPVGPNSDPRKKRSVFLNKSAESNKNPFANLAQDKLNNFNNETKNRQIRDSMDMNNMDNRYALSQDQAGTTNAGSDMTGNDMIGGGGTSNTPFIPTDPMNNPGTNGTGSANPTFSSTDVNNIRGINQGASMGMINKYGSSRIKNRNK